ncbi:30S ribosomal protein S2 [Candidatus Pacearchaeota archaeon]|nr:30S ribosomal protein S2 [Candidatus Pacearchaeota archaeon]
MPRAKKSDSVSDNVEETVKKISSSSEHEKKLAQLKEKAAKLAEGIKSEDVDIRKKIKPEEKKDALAPIEDYLKSSIHLGTRAITPDMKPYVYKRRADSLAVFNTSLLDDKIKEGAEYLAQYAPDEAIVVCKRESGAKAVELFSKITGIRAFIKKYPAGIITNPNLDNFLETEMIFVCDPWTDKSALIDAKRIKIPVLAICDTNNYTADIDKIIPGNNKSAKSLGMIFYLIAKIYVEKRKLGVKIPPVSEWIDNWENLQPPK